MTLSSSFRIFARSSSRSISSQQFSRQFSFTSKLLQAEVLDNDVGSGGLAPMRRIRNIAIIAHGGWFEFLVNPICLA